MVLDDLGPAEVHADWGISDTEGEAATTESDPGSAVVSAIISAHSGPREDAENCSCERPHR